MIASRRIGLGPFVRKPVADRRVAHAAEPHKYRDWIPPQVVRRSILDPRLDVTLAAFAFADTVTTDWRDTACAMGARGVGAAEIGRALGRPRVDVFDLLHRRRERAAP